MTNSGMTLLGMERHGEMAELFLYLLTLWGILVLLPSCGLSVKYQRYHSWYHVYLALSIVHCIRYPWALNVRDILLQEAATTQNSGTSWYTSQRFCEGFIHPPNAGIRLFTSQCWPALTHHQPNINVLQGDVVIKSIRQNTDIYMYDLHTLLTLPLHRVWIRNY